MRAVVCRGPRDYVVEQVDDPRVGDDEVALRVEAVGICASDVKSSTLAEPLSCSLHAVERASIEFEDTVVIAGMPPVAPPASSKA